MKCSKKVLALVTVFVLILSMSAVAYASTGPYYYTVTKTGEYTGYNIVSGDTAVHSYGRPDVLSFSYSTKTYYFDQSQFNSAHNSGLMQAYRNAGLLTTLTAPAKSGTVTVPANAVNGVYKPALYCKYAKGTWNVTLDTTITYSGTFTASPMECWMSTAVV